MGFSPLSANNFVAKTKGEGEYAYAKELGKKKMTKLMYKDENAKNNDKRKC